MTKKKQHGGARKGAGRPKKEPTKTLAYRVPAKDSKAIDTEIRDRVLKPRGIKPKKKKK